ncbi:caspase family protein [Tardiphaga sp. 803_E3_N1_3]|uniref:caspase family protein n=1 Tax=Tardiphaga sp. 803_E3_N1_3 TaxID=3240785 RepID=UPI003F25F554
MKFEHGRALVIGVANYEDVGTLPEAVLNDARDIAETLQAPAYCGYPVQNVTVLIDKQATLEGIRKALADLASAAAADDTVAIFFSGHGARLGKGEDATSALVPYDCKRANPKGTTLGEAELSLAIAALQAQRVVVIIDACHAGGAASLKSDLGNGLDKGFHEKSLQELASGTGRVVFASSRSTETSLVLKSERNSVFTTAMLSGLKGAAPASAGGTINVFDLFNYISETVRQAVPGRQHPIFKASQLEDNFPVALAMGGAKSANSGGDAPRQRDLEGILADLFPMGPTDQDIWLRAGGDLSRLKVAGNGRSQWFSAIRVLAQGGGGAGISRVSLIEAALEEFPNHRELQALL